MKKLFVSVCAVCLSALMVLSGCGSGRSLYNYDLSKYITIDSYEIEVDTSSDTYQNYYASKISDGLSYEKKEGTVADGDTANIDFVGYLNGEKFDGGTGSDYDLTIGSGSFIPGFEDSLIGAEIGQTTDINVTFPENYGVEELNGQPVVFSVTVNYVSAVYELTEENVKTLGYDSVAAFEQEAKDYAVKLTAWETLYQNAQIISFPEKESKLFLDEAVSYYENLCSQNDITFEQLADVNNMTVDELKEYIQTNNVESDMTMDLLSYSVLDSEDYAISDSDIKRAEQEITKDSGKTPEELGYGDAYVETYAAYLAACDILLKNATVK